MPINRVSTRRENPGLFADVRGCTGLADNTQERVVGYVREHQLTGGASEACSSEFAQETLPTVNTYLTCVIAAATREHGNYDKLNNPSTVPASGPGKYYRLHKP